MNQHQDAEKMADKNCKASPQCVDQCLPSSTNTNPIDTPLKASSTISSSINETTPFLTPSTSMSSTNYLPSYSTIVPPDGPFPVCSFTFPSRPSARSSRFYPSSRSITQFECENLKSTKVVRTLGLKKEHTSSEYEDEDATIQAERQNIESKKVRRTLGLQSPKLNQEGNGNGKVKSTTPNPSARRASALLNSKRSRLGISKDITITFPPRYLRTTSMSASQLKYQKSLSRDQNEAENGGSSSSSGNDDISPRSSPRLFKRYGSHCLFSFSFPCSCLMMMVLWFAVIAAACVGFAWVLLRIQGRV
jgi:hypothetical protein